MNPGVPRLHAVTEDTIARLPDLETRASALALSAGVALHARLPRGEGKALLNLTTLLRRAAVRSGAAVFVNDRVDVALLSGATGVHLPADGLPTAVARELAGPGVFVGRSTHHPDEVRRAADEGVDYVFLGPIWETSSHPTRLGIGVEALRDLGSMPVIAIGGITPERAALCREAGAWGVAAISGLWLARDPAAAARAMLLSFSGSS